MKVLFEQGDDSTVFFEIELTRKEIASLSKIYLTKQMKDIVFGGKRISVAVMQAPIGSEDGSE